MEEESASALECVRCTKPLGAAQRAASISGSIMGDEHTDAYFLCPVCDVYTLFRWWDNFTGVETVDRSGPVERPAGDARVALIEKCAQPWDKHCRCDAHLAYFGPSLD